MTDPSINGDGRDSPGRPATGGDRGIAALLLVESLIHELVARSLLSVQQAIDVIEIAADVELEQASVPIDGMPVLGRPSVLTPMADSLRFNLDS